ncbi:hypothetical protein EZS27_006057 [termite gut metagenome]|uniref:AAA+ ATPase domain-containing protein n=1 Tax=termite gut metagenome TaxID=433724 RepID=A0A5J4SK47_9ZZZZ
MAKARSIKEVLKMQPPKIKLTGRWAKAFGEIAKTGTWLVWGKSGNGKSSFVMQLCKELAKFGRVLYIASEEGYELSTKNSLERHNMIEVNNRVTLLDEEPLSELNERLDKNKSPDFIVIDSYQSYGFTYRMYLEFKKKHKDKLLIFISHAEGKNPKGSDADSTQYNVGQKVYVEGYRAFTRGRFYGQLGYYDIWEEKAVEYWSKRDMSRILE